MKISDMKCIFCHKSGVTLHRINEKGVPGIWACTEHRNLSDKNFDPALDKLIGIISGKNIRKRLD